MAAVEELFDVVTGVQGEDQTVVSECVPLWKARNQIVTLLNAEAKTCADEHRSLSLRFTELAAEFRECGVGAVLDGYVRHWQSVDGVERFIGMVPTTTDYRQAGRVVEPPPRPKRKPVSFADFEGYAEPIPQLSSRRSRPNPEEIARKMAKAAHDATRKET